MKRLFLIAGCLLVLGSSPVVADSMLVVVRVYEAAGKIRVVTIRGTGLPEVQDIETGLARKGAVDSAKAYYDVLARLYEEGYHLQSSVNGSFEPGTSSTTFVLVKENS